MNLLITRHDKIGDFVVTLPLFKAIKEQYPNAKLTALVSKVNFDFAKNIDFIDDVILFDKNNLSKTKNISDFLLVEGLGIKTVEKISLLLRTKIKTDEYIEQKLF